MVIKFKKDPYIIAEIGINHNGYLSLAKRMIKLSKDAGADAVKFQRRSAEDLVANLGKLGNSTGYLSKNENDTNHKAKKFGTWVYPDLRLELSEKDYYEIKKYCKKINIDLIVTPWDEKSVDFLIKLGVKYLKVASIDANNYHFCEYVAKKKYPTIISTGMCTYEEILITQKIFKKNKCKHIFLHCTSAYPSDEKDKNLNCIPKLRLLLKEDVGFSGHGIGLSGSVGATALGAKVIEKHVTLNKKMLGPDHAASLEFPLFKNLVESVRKVKLSLGSDLKKFQKSEQTLHNVLIRKFITRVDVKKNEKISFKNVKTALIYSKRGILPKMYYKILNKKFRKNLKKNSTIEFNLLT